jgi:hypothetical protein
MRYFDQKFWKMFSGFITIIVISALIIFIARVYQTNQMAKSVPVGSIQSVQ